MIRVGNGKIELNGPRREVQAELMMLVDHVKESRLFDSDEDLEMALMFVMLDEDKQKECMVEIISEMIDSLEKSRKKSSKKKDEE